MTMTKQELQIAVVIPTFNRERVLVRTIENVLRQSLSPDELIVIDQSTGHDLETLDALSAWEGQGALKWVRVPVPNLPAARNLGLKVSTCDIVVFIDDDVELPPDFIAAHARNFSNSRISAVAGGVLGTNSGFRHWIPADKNAKIFAYEFQFNFSARYEGLAKVPGCNHSVRRKAAIGIGGYDEAFLGSAQGEDRDFGYRLAERGHLIVYDPAAYLIHLFAPSGGCRTANNNSFNEFQKLASLCLFWAKHLRTFTPMSYLWLLLRTGPLRRENLKGPLRQISSWVSLARAMRYALKMSQPLEVQRRERLQFRDHHYQNGCN